jgi:hypothetical protein
MKPTKPTKPTRPAVGDVVHFLDYGIQTCQAAIVTAIAPTAQHPADLRARLTVFTPSGGMFGAWAEEGSEQAQWHWVEAHEEEGEGENK